MTAHDAITEIRATLDAIPDTPEGLDGIEAVKHMVAKYLHAVAEIRRITERLEVALRVVGRHGLPAGVDEVAERIPDAQGALFDLPKPTPPSAIREGR